MLESLFLGDALQCLLLLLTLVGLAIVDFISSILPCVFTRPSSEDISFARLTIFLLSFPSRKLYPGILGSAVAEMGNADLREVWRSDSN